MVVEWTCYKKDRTPMPAEGADSILRKPCGD